MAWPNGRQVAHMTASLDHTRNTLLPPRISAFDWRWRCELTHSVLLERSRSVTGRTESSWWILRAAEQLLATVCPPEEWTTQVATDVEAGINPYTSKPPLFFMTSSDGGCKLISHGTDNFNINLYWFRSKLFKKLKNLKIILTLFFFYYEC